MQNEIDERSTAKDDEQKPQPFTPFVRRLGEHLDASGRICTCTNENSRAVPKVMPVPAPKQAELRGSVLLDNFVFLEQERRDVQKWEKGKA